MSTEPVTYGRLADLIVDAGYEAKQMDEQRIGYFSKAEKNFFVLPICPPETPARGNHVAHVRFQLDWRGQMTAREFDARLAAPATATA